MVLTRKNRQLSIAVIISGGRTVLVLAPNPAELIIVELTPCTIWNIDSIKSNPYTTTVYANANLKNNLNACSGFFTSENELQVLITPAKKKITSNAIPYCLHCSVYINNYIPYTTVP